MTTNKKHPFTIALLITICAMLILCTACAVSSTDVLNELVIIFAGIPPIIAAAGTLIPGPIGIALTTTSTLIGAALTLVLKALQTYNTNPTSENLQTVTTTINAAHAQVQQFKAANTVTDPVTADKLTAFANTATTALANIEAHTLAKHPPNPAPQNIPTDHK